MRNLVDLLVWICRFGTCAAFLGIIYAVVVQIMGRTAIFRYSPVFTEELTRFCLLWMVAFAAGLSLRSGDLINVDFVSSALPRRMSKMLRLVCAAIIVLLCAMLLEPAWLFMMIGRGQTSSAMGWRMDLFNMSIAVLLTTLMVFAMIQFASILREPKDSGPAESEVSESD